MNYRKREEIPEEETPIWVCTKESCKGWMRDNFAFEQQPTCPLCDSPMERGTRMLPIVANTGGDRKAKKGGTQADGADNE